MALNPFQYDAAVLFVDEDLKKKVQPCLKSKPKVYKRALEKWFELTHDEKVKVIELVEELQSVSIARKIINADNEIPVPRVGSFKYDLGKFYYHTHREELMQLDSKERIIRIGKYKKANFKKYNARHNGKVLSITKITSEGKIDIL